jgi:hypothetical protein
MSGRTVHSSTSLRRRTRVADGDRRTAAVTGLHLLAPRARRHIRSTLVMAISTSWSGASRRRGGGLVRLRSTPAAASTCSRPSEASGRAAEHERLSTRRCSPQVAPRPGERVIVYLGSRSQYPTRRRRLRRRARGGISHRRELAAHCCCRLRPRGYQRSTRPTRWCRPKRLERFIFWPMGAVRGPCHRATTTAFIGRHFDDPRLIEHSIALAATERNGNMQLCRDVQPLKGVMGGKLAHPRPACGREFDRC